jgi:hypothetical protein
MGTPPNIDTWFFRLTKKSGLKPPLGNENNKLQYFRLLASTVGIVN